MKIKKVVVYAALIFLIAGGSRLLSNRSNSGVIVTSSPAIKKDDSTISEDLVNKINTPFINGDNPDNPNIVNVANKNSIAINLDESNNIHTNAENYIPTIIGKIIIDNENPVNIRAGGSTDYEQIAEVKPGEKFPCIGIFKDSDWYGIVLPDNRIGYLSNNLALFYPNPDYEQIIGTVVVTHEYSVNVRKGGSTDYDQIDEVKPGEEFPCIGTSKDKGNSWYCIILSDGRVGYVSSTLTSLHQDPNSLLKK